MILKPPPPPRFGGSVVEINRPKTFMKSFPKINLGNPGENIVKPKE
jgi:hypothetical protein